MNPVIYCSVVSCDDKIWMLFGLGLCLFFGVGAALMIFNAIKGLFD